MARVSCHHLVRRLGYHFGHKPGWKTRTSPATSGTSPPTSFDGVSVQHRRHTGIRILLQPQPDQCDRSGRSHQWRRERASDHARGYTATSLRRTRKISRPSLFMFTPVYPAAAHDNGVYLVRPILFRGVVTQPAKPGKSFFVRHRFRPIQSAGACRTIGSQRCAAGAIGQRHSGRPSSQRPGLSGLCRHVSIQSDGSATAGRAMRRCRCRLRASRRKAGIMLSIGP